MIKKYEIGEHPSFNQKLKSLIQREMDYTSKGIILLLESNDFLEKAKGFSIGNPGDWLSNYVKGVRCYLMARTGPLVHLKLAQLEVRLLLKSQIRYLKNRSKPMLLLMNRIVKMAVEAEDVEVRIHECIDELAPLEKVPDGIIDAVNTIITDTNLIQDKMLFNMKEYLVLGPNRTSKELLPIVENKRIPALGHALDPENLTSFLRMLETIIQETGTHKRKMAELTTHWQESGRLQLASLETLQVKTRKAQQEIKRKLPKSKLDTSFRVLKILLVLLLAGGFWYVTHPGLRSVCLVALMIWAVQSIRLSQS